MTSHELAEIMIELDDPFQRLALAVLRQAIEDVSSTNGNIQDDARNFFQDDDALDLWSYLAKVPARDLSRAYENK